MRNARRTTLLLALLGAVAALARADTAVPPAARVAAPAAQRVYIQPVPCTCIHPDHGVVHLVRRDGRDVVPFGRSTHSDARLAPDGETYGFLTGRHLKGYEPPRFVDDRLELWRGPRRLRVLAGDPLVRDWAFRDGGRRVAIYAGPMHGPGWYHLVDVATGEERGSWRDFDARPPPAWVGELDPAPAKDARPRE